MWNNQKQQKTCNFMRYSVQENISQDNVNIWVYEYEISIYFVNLDRMDMVITVLKYLTFFIIYIYIY